MKKIKDTLMNPSFWLAIVIIGFWVDMIGAVCNYKPAIFVGGLMWILGGITMVVVSDSLPDDDDYNY